MPPAGYMPMPTEDERRRVGHWSAMTPDWCTDIQPFMEAYCNACHAVPPTTAAPATFRLDVYESDPAGVPGAFEKAERIYVRTVVTRDMPPEGWLQPSEAELQRSPRGTAPARRGACHI